MDGVVSGKKSMRDREKDRDNKDEAMAMESSQEGNTDDEGNAAAAQLEEEELMQLLSEGPMEVQQ